MRYFEVKKIIGVIGIVFLMSSFSFQAFGAGNGGMNPDTTTDTKEDESVDKQADTPAAAPAACSKMYFDKDLKKEVCCEGILLNTDVPFIGRCINLVKKGSTDTQPAGTNVTQDEAFPVLMGGLTKIMVTIIILMGFIGILAGGVMISASGGDEQRAGEGRKLIIRVVVALALLGASGVILRLINPNFFG